MKEEVQTPDQAVLEMAKAIKEVEEKAAFYGCTFVWAVALMSAVESEFAASGWTSRAFVPP